MLTRGSWSHVYAEKVNLIVSFLQPRLPGVDKIQEKCIRGINEEND